MWAKKVREENKKKIITREAIASDLKAESKRILVLFVILTVGSLAFAAFIITASTIYNWGDGEIFAILIFVALPTFFAILSIKQIADLIIYSSDKLIIVEDRLYKTVPYEKYNRHASSTSTPRYDHGLYFEKYGKFTVVGEKMEINFDGNSDYWLVIVNGKKPKILRIYRKDKYEYKN